eukprot:TRINITY_DN31117_c0_g1_i1.p1 TRINITY_DN31117_c0_g1~~TRINITY_DN31117_c0_g1_i1.p1  ORF type:complete len:326 (+),score=46.55 TRINITY_DN31117_c0_g1_i1:91-1068(+)
MTKSALNGVLLCAVVILNTWYNVAWVKNTVQPSEKELEPVNTRLQKLYDQMVVKGSSPFEKAEQVKAANFSISRKFFDFDEASQAWVPAAIDFGMDYGLAIRLDHAKHLITKLNSDIRKIFPPTAMYLSPRGHHVTIQHLNNLETKIKKHTPPDFNRIIHNVFLPSISDLLASAETDRIYIDMTHLVLSKDDGSLILLGKVSPDGVLHRLRKEIWSKYEQLNIPGVRDSPWEVIHCTVGRLLPSPPSSGVGLNASEAQLEALDKLIRSYNKRKPSDRIHAAVALSDSVRYLHNRAMFSVETYHSIPLSSFGSRSFIRNVNLTFGG